MIETISTLEMRQRLGDILNRVSLRHDQFIVERKGKPLAAMVPVERLEQMQQAARLHLTVYLRAAVWKCLTRERQIDLADEAKHRLRVKTQRNVVRAQSCSRCQHFRQRADSAPRTTRSDSVSVSLQSGV